jgi:hypothetical protein
MSAVCSIVIVAIPESAGSVSANPAVWAQRIFTPSSAPAWVKALFMVRERLVEVIGVGRTDSEL